MSAPLPVPASPAEARAIVERIYQEVFDRTPGSDEIDYHVRSGLGERRFLALAMRSEEFRARMAERSHSQDLLLAGQDRGGPIRHVVSLGSHCLTSSMLKRWSLKRWSGPFDWVFSSPGMVAFCLQDRLCSFLDRSQHVFVPTPIRDAHLHHGDSYCEHLLFSSRFGVENLFNHRDARDEQHYASYQRAADRLNRILDGGERTLFLCLVPFWRHREDDFEELVFQLRSRSPASVLLYIVMHPHQSDRTLPLLACTHHTAFLRRYEMTPVSHPGPTAFASTIDELMVSAVVHHFLFDLSETSGERTRSIQAPT